MTQSFADRKRRAQQHVASGRRLVTQQRREIAEIKARQGDSSDSQMLLSTFEMTLAIFEQDLSEIEAGESGTHA